MPKFDVLFPSAFFAIFITQALWVWCRIGSRVKISHYIQPSNLPSASVHSKTFKYIRLGRRDILGFGQMFSISIKINRSIITMAKLQLLPITSWVLLSIWPNSMNRKIKHVWEINAKYRISANGACTFKQNSIFTKQILHLPKNLTFNQKLHIYQKIQDLT